MRITRPIYAHLTLSEISQSNENRVFTAVHDIIHCILGWSVLSLYLICSYRVVVKFICASFSNFHQSKCRWTVWGQCTNTLAPILGIISSQHVSKNMVWYVQTDHTWLNPHSACCRSAEWQVVLFWKRFGGNFMRGEVQGVTDYVFRTSQVSACLFCCEKCLPF